LARVSKLESVTAHDLPPVGKTAYVTAIVTAWRSKKPAEAGWSVT
jgi:hypothetical protein